MADEFIREMIKNPNKVYDEMLKNNPDFRKFVEDNKHKTTEELISEHNLDEWLKWKY